MKLKTLSLAIAAISCGAAAPAFAITAANYDAAHAANFYISGSSAQRGGLEAFLRSDICDLTGSNTLDAYLVNSNWRVYLCKPSSAVTGLNAATTQVAIYYSTFGGSAFGVAPVAQGLVPSDGGASNHGFLDLTKIAAAQATLATAFGTGVTVTTGSPTLSAFTQWTLAAVSTGAPASSTVVTDVVSDAGFSDVEPNLFVGTTLGGGVTVLTTDPNALNTVSPYAVVFGVPVTKKLRDALQTAQISSGAISSSCTVGDETEACMPTLNKSQLTSLYTGAYTSSTSLGLAGGAANDLYFVSRPSTSGTRKLTDVYFTGKACGIAGVAGLRAASTPDTSTTLVVNGTTNLTKCGSTFNLLASGGGDMAACLKNINTASKYGFGLITTESVPNTNAASDSGWRFIKINGKAPTLLNVAEGSYDFYGEASFNTPNGSVAPALTGDKLALASFIGGSATGLSKSANLVQVNAALVQSFGAAGLLGFVGVSGNTANTLPFSATSIAANPMIPFSKHQISLNNCQLPQGTSPSDAGL